MQFSKLMNGIKFMVSRTWAVVVIAYYVVIVCMFAENYVGAYET